MSTKDGLIEMSMSNGYGFGNANIDDFLIRALDPAQLIHVGPAQTSSTSNSILVVSSSNIQVTGFANFQQNVGVGTVPARRFHVVAPNNNLMLLTTDTSAVGQVAGLEMGTPNNVRSKVFCTTKANDKCDLMFSVQNGTNTTVNAMYISEAGYVGIGTSSPSYTLDVIGNTRINNILYMNDQIQTCVLCLYKGSTPTATDTKYIGLGINNNLFRYHADVPTTDHAFFNDSNELMRIKGSGNVGIGTTTPSQKLEVNGTIKCSSLNAGTSIAVYGTNNATWDHMWLHHDGSIGYIDVGGASTMYIRIGNSGTGDINGQTYTNIMTLLQAGNVGIGTTSPIEQLHVASKIYCETQMLGNSNDSVSLPSFAFRGDLNTGMYHASNQTIGFTTSGIERMRVNNSGNVGIGTTNPLYSLHVVGDIFATQNITSYSDCNLKTDIKNIDHALDKLLKMNGYTYRRIDDISESTVTKRHVGLIAQEVREVTPEIVSEDGEGKLSIAYGNMAALFVEAIKELKKHIDDIKMQLTQKK